MATYSASTTLTNPSLYLRHIDHQFDRFDPETVIVVTVADADKIITILLIGLQGAALTRYADLSAFPFLVFPEHLGDPLTLRHHQGTLTGRSYLFFY